MCWNEQPWAPGACPPIIYHSHSAWAERRGAEGGRQGGGREREREAGGREAESERATEQQSKRGGERRESRDGQRRRGCARTKCPAQERARESYALGKQKRENKDWLMKEDRDQVL